MVTGAIDINPNPGSYRAMDRDMAAGSSSGPDDAVTQSDRAGRSDQHGPGSSMALEHSHGHRLWSRSLESMRPLVATWAMNINRDAMPSVVKPWTQI